MEWSHFKAVGGAMEMFSYVMVLASVIAGLAITQLLQCVAGMVQHPNQYKAYWVHLVWVVYAFEYVALWWWYEWNLAKTAEWSFALYLFILGYAVVIYLMCAVLAPLSLNKLENFEAYYYSRRRWFLALAALVILFDVADTLSKGASHFASLGWHYSIGAIGFPILYVIGMTTRSRRYHASIAVISMVDHASQAFQNFWILR
jgi:hypothetical protein